MEYGRFTTIRTLRKERRSLLEKLAQLTGRDTASLEDIYNRPDLSEMTTKKMGSKAKSCIKSTLVGVRSKESTIVLCRAIRKTLIVALIMAVALCIDTALRQITPGFSVGKDFYAAVVQLFPMLIIALYLSDKAVAASYKEVLLFINKRYTTLLVAATGTVSSLFPLVMGGSGLTQLIATIIAVLIVIISLTKSALPRR